MNYHMHLNSGHVSSKNMQTPSPSPIRSGHLDIKYVQCAETKDVVKKSYHIISRIRVMGVQKVQKGAQKIKFSSKVAKFAGNIRIDMIMIFYIDSFFCATLSFLDIVNFSNYCVQILQAFY